jgi:glycosyltransferase involved in cell wall biosynthesis
VKPPRLVMVVRRFWPLVGGPERLLANLAVELAGRGCEVIVLTARWKPAWPARIQYYGLPVVRLSSAPDSYWGMLRYLRSLARWLRVNDSRYDLIYVSALRHEAAMALRVANASKPVVLRAERAGIRGDCLWQTKVACGRRIKRHCTAASALIAPSELIGQELIAAEYPASRIRLLSNGVPVPPARTPESKAAARAVLAETHAALNLPDDAPLAVYAGRLNQEKGAKNAIIAWRQVLGRWPKARLWLAGEGPDRAALQRHIDTLNLSARVLLTGVFDAIIELLAAADLFIAPATEADASVAIMEAMAAGLPVVSTDAAGHRACLTDGQEGLLVPVQDPSALAAAIVRLLDEPALAARLGAAARERAIREFSLSKMAEEHLALFGELTQRYQ